MLRSTLGNVAEVTTHGKKNTDRGGISVDLRLPQTLANDMKSKGTAVPLPACTGTYGSRRLGIPELLDSRHMKVVMLLVLRTGHLYPEKILIVVRS